LDYDIKIALQISIFLKSILRCKQFVILHELNFYIILSLIVLENTLLINVTHFMRRSEPGAHSIERLFEDIRSHLPGDIRVTVCENKFPSKGLVKRIYDMIRAGRHQGDVNHITGDVHFLTYLLNHRRTILTIHDCVLLERFYGIKHWLLWLFWYWLPSRRCACMTVISEATRQQALRHLKCDPAKIHVIYNNVSEEFRPFPKTFNAISPRILQIGTGPNKNIERVAEALSGMDCRLVIIGHLSLKQIHILKYFQIHYENHVNLSRQALVEQYNLCDFVVFVSIYEGFGLPIVEANAVGRPVVTSNIWSMPEIARDAACLVDPFDVASIRGGLDKVIGDPAYRAHLVQAGFKNVKRFEVNFIAGQYAQLYRNMYALGNMK